MKTFGYIIIFIILPHSLFSQLLLEKEEFTNGVYRLEYSNIGYQYSITEKGGKKYINVVNDRNSVEAQNIPTQNLFIALPPNLQPRIRMTVAESQQRVSAPAGNNVKKKIDMFTIKGFLWIENYYCAHIEVQPFFQEPNTGTISELQKLILEIDLPKSEYALAVSRPKVKRQDVPIDNALYGPVWRATKPVYALLQTDSWIDYSSEYVKLGVVNDGIYRIRFNDLIAYGIPAASVNPRMFKLYLKGKEIPIYVRGEQDNAFGPDDYIEFLGRKNYGDVRYRDPAPFNNSYYEYLNLYSDTTIYWLQWTGSLGIRVDTLLNVHGSVIDTLRYYDCLTRVERNNYWDFSLVGDILRKNYPEIYENETWYDGNLSVGKYSETFSLADLYPNAPARAFTKIQNFSSNVDLKAHNLALTINSKSVKYDSGFIDKYQVKTLKANFLSSELQNGNNTVDIHSFPTSNTINIVARDWVELEYPRYLKAINDTMNIAYNNISSPGYKTLIITGLSNASVLLYKFTLADSTMVKVTNYIRSGDTLRFNDSIANGTYYFLKNDLAIPQPLFFSKKKFINLKNSTNTAEYIAISHPYFQSIVASYVSFISSSYGITAKYVDVVDIYDEFNFGFSAPEPIKDFLKSTQTLWTSPKPKYVVIIGKGTYDFYGYKTKNFGAPKTTNYVPSYGNPVSDIWFVQWDTTGSLIPQMNIGRIPAKNITEFQSYFAKHQKFLSKGFDDWNKRFLFYSGGNFTEPNQITQSKGVNDFIINNYVLPPPIGGSVSNFYKTVNPITNFGPYTSEYYTNAIEQGGVFISYIGHSGTQTWDNSITNITQLANTRDRSPMISDFGCSTAKFAESDVVSFSELAVCDIQGQAISYIGNSSLGFTSTAYTFPQYFYKKLLVDTAASLGDVHRLAKIDYIKQFGTLESYGLFIKTNTLIGDPIIQLPIPKKPNYSLTKSVVELLPQRPTEQTDSAQILMSYFNQGTVIGDSIEFEISSKYKGSVVLTKTIKRKVPFFKDSIVLMIPVKNQPGEHEITITVDPLNVMNEIYENDNTLKYTFLVASTSIRSLSLSPTVNQSNGTFLFLNPAIQPTISAFTIDVSLTETFSQFQRSQVPYGTFITQFSLDTGYYRKRIWVRTKYDEASPEGLIYSYYVGTKENILYDDKYSFNTLTYHNSKQWNNAILLDTAVVVFKSISGGFNDGKTAVITKDGQNYVSESTKRGHHVCLFDAVTYEFIGEYTFDLLVGGASVAAEYKNLLDSLSQKYLIIISISDEGGLNLTAELKSSLKSIGSKYIDSVQFRYSWSIIGRKGAVPGTVPEGFSPLFGGQVVLDTTFYKINAQGSFITNSIGPVAVWNTINTQYFLPTGSSISLGLIGVKIDNTYDTLQQNIPIDSVISIATVNAALYPSIRLFGTLNAGIENISPALSKIEVNYRTLPELGTNFQVFKGYLFQNNLPGKEIAPSDTIVQGSNIRFTFRIYNVGKTTAKEISYQLASLWDNNYVEPITAGKIDSIPSEQYREITIQYSTSLGSGRRNIQLSIDPDTTIREFYKDNNFYTFPIVVKKSPGNPLLPNLSITQQATKSSPAQITDETDTAKFTIVYSNTGTLVNDSLSIQIKHFYQSNLQSTLILRKKYPVSYDTVRLSIPILKNAGDHQLSIELDYNGLIVESSETDNLSNYYFTVATTDFKVLFPTANSISVVKEIIFLNPTTFTEGNSTVKLELDTVPSFMSPQTIVKPIQQFATSFTLLGLKTLRRYYWRVKIENSSRDWTTGSFFSGDSLSSAFGQLDSISWKQNIFTRTSYSLDSGARIVDTKYSIKALSAGFDDGNNGSITINGVNVISPILGSGHNVVVVDTNSFTVISQRRFDTGINPNESDSLIQFIAAVPNGRYVIDVIVDDGANNITQATRNAFKTLGSAFIDQVSFRDSWSIIGKKGAVIGSVPETYKVHNSGSAVAETSIIHVEISGIIETSPVGPFASLSQLTIDQFIPSGAQLKTQFVGISATNTLDTLLSVINQSIISLNTINTKLYRNGKLVFHLFAPPSFNTQQNISAMNTPLIKQWKMTATPSTELVVSNVSTMINRNQVMEGEYIQFTGRIFNVSNVAAESVTVQLKTIASGIENIVKQQQFSRIPANDSVSFSFSNETRGKRGNYAFTFIVDPNNNLSELMKNNNSVTIPYQVQADTLRPTIQITFDGIQIVNGDYVTSQPEIRIRYTDNNPSILLPSDTSNFKITMNNTRVPFIKGSAELLNTNTIGRADIRWTPTLASGENIIQISAKDIAGNYSDTLLIYINVASDFKIMDIFNLPNPFNNSTAFTFNLAGPANPDEIIIKIYTVTGRLIQELSTPGMIGFNKILWDGRDKDGDTIGNGVYLYKVIVKLGNKQVEGLSKLVKMR